MTPGGQVLYFFQLGLSIVCEQAHHSSVVNRVDDGVGVESGYTVVCILGVQQGAQNAALGCSSVKDEGERALSAHPHHLWSGCHEVKDPYAQ